MSIKISNTNDWQNLQENRLETVVDPMVYRCGELFLKGSNNVNSPEEVWNLLSKNIYGIGMFFDNLILNEKLPVFNYGDTFDAMLNFDERVLTKVNEYQEILFDINVEYEQYHEVKSAAIKELSNLFQGPGKIKQSLAKDILSELSTTEYHWQPNLEELNDQLEKEEERKLASFLLGGLIFGGYAQILGGDHILQPKRSRLFLSVTLNSNSSDYKLEENLFNELKAKSNANCENVPWLPTFFPYLLSKTNTTKELLKEVIELRNSNEIGDYRKWLNEVKNDWNKTGKISIEKRKDVKLIANYINRKIGIIPSAPNVEMKTTIADVVAMKPPIGVDFTPSLNRLWGWFISSLPGKRYRKLLTRAIVADIEFVKLEKRIKEFWKTN